MKTIYESTFISVGPSANESLEDNFIITFGEGASGRCGILLYSPHRRE